MRVYLALPFFVIFEINLPSHCGRLALGLTRNIPHFALNDIMSDSEIASQVDKEKQWY